MSLLMEALRKAEQAKRRMQEEEAARGGAEASSNPATSFTLEEREPGVTPEYIRDNFTARETDAAGLHADAALTDALPFDDAAHPDEAGEHARHAAQRQRAAAASVFTAKQKPAGNRRTLTVLVAILLLILPVGGGILWYLQSATTSSIGLNPALANYDLSSRSFDAAPEAALDTNVAAPVVGEPDVETGVEAASIEPEPTRAEDADATMAANDEPAAVASAAPEQEESITAVASAQAPSATPSADAPTNANLALPASAAGPVLEISRSRGMPQVNPDLSAAYTRLQQGDVAGAGTLYRQVLAEQPNNRDALLGLALVLMREGQPANARELYARLLELNPRDPLAHTGLLQIAQYTQSGSPAEHEAALKTLIGQFPNVAQLTLALGNHYAAQGRWSEAQAAYYNALLAARRSTNGPVHPDYAFNLAVSLEQLNQPQAALDYYRQAQALAIDVTPGFDPQLLNERLDYLQSEQAPR